MRYTHENMNAREVQYTGPYDMAKFLATAREGVARDRVSSLNEARRAMRQNFRKALRTYTLNIVPMQREFWVSNGVISTGNHKDPSPQIWQAMHENKTGAFTRTVGEFFETACAFDHYIQAEPDDEYKYNEECFKTLLCFIKFIPCYQKFPNEDDLFRHVYDIDLVFKRQFDEALQCMVAYLKEIHDRSSLTLFAKYKWPLILEKLQKQPAKDKTAAEKAAVDKAAADAKKQTPRRVTMKPPVPRQNVKTTALLAMRACLDAREALF